MIKLKNRVSIVVGVSISAVVLFTFIVTARCSCDDSGAVQPGEPVQAMPAASTQSPGSMPETSAVPVIKSEKNKKQMTASAPRAGLLVFPLDSSEVEQEGNLLGRLVADALKDGTLRSARYVGISYSPRLPVVRRAVDETVLKQSDLQVPFTLSETDKQRAQKIGRVMDIPKVLLGQVTDFEFEREKNEAQITVTAEIVDVASGISEHILVATGKSPASMPPGRAPEEYALKAAEDAAKQLSAKLPGVIPPEETVAVQPEAAARKKKSQGGLLLGVLALVGIIAAVSGGGSSSGSGGGPDNPPPPPY